MTETTHTLAPEIKAALTLLVSSCFRADQQLLTIMSFDDIEDSVAGSDEEPTALVLCISTPRAKALRLYEEITHLVKFSPPHSP